MKRIRAKIHGFVQRVGFRNFVRKNASNLGLTGWVKNNLDGTVEAVFEGDGDLINKVIDACHKGPFLAWVVKVEVNEEEPRKEFDDFVILR